MDAKSWDELQQSGPILEKNQFEKYQFLIKKYGLKTKNSESDIQPLSHNDEAHLSFEKGVSFANKGNYEQALIYYDEAIASNPRMTAAYLNKGVALSTLSRFKEANEVFDKVLTMQPDSNTAWVNKGNALWHLNDYKGAEESYKKALLLNPDQHKIWQNLGNLYLNMHRDEEARRCFEKENFYKNMTLQLPDEPRMILPEKTPFPANIYLPAVFFFWEHAILIILFSGISAISIGIWWRIKGSRPKDDLFR
jgi:tetratricopeptide (TPR) repeat protein